MPTSRAARLLTYRQKNTFNKFRVPLVDLAANLHAWFIRADERIRSKRMSATAKAAMILAALALPLPRVQAQMQGTSIFATEVHPKVVLLTHDDGFDEVAPDGTNQTIAVAQKLYSWGLPGAFFVVGCHFDGLSTTDPRSSLCIGPGDRPFNLLQQLLDLDFVPFNHSLSHVSFPSLSATELVSEVRTLQTLLSPFQRELGLHLLRAPGLACGPREANIISSQPGLMGIRGPLSADVGGWLIQPDGVTPMGGDWDCYERGMTPQACGALYVNGIKANSANHGVVVLLHTRTEFMTGRDGSRYASQLLDYIYANLGAEYTFAPVDAIPGLLGNIRAPKPAPASDEFGTADGQGPVIYGDINGDGRADACKARDGKVWCMLNQLDSRAGEVRFLPSESWFQVDDPAWTAEYGSTFWLVDWNGDGKKDLVIPAAQGFLVAYSNGVGFSHPQPWKVQLVATGWTPDLLKTVRFGDFNGDGRVDVIALATAGVIGAVNNGGGFNAPAVLSPFFAGGGWTAPQYASTLQFRDINGDGLDDICVRGASETFVGLSNGTAFEVGMGWTRRFNDRQGWGGAAYYPTFSLAKIGGNLGIVGGTSSGVVFQKADPAHNRFSLYRYLNNSDYSNDPNWKPERYASGLAFADFDRSGNESPAFTEANGVYVSLIGIVKD